MKQPIAIVGASTRAAAASAIRAGFQPITADLFADADLRAIATTTPIAPYPEGLVDWLRTIEPPAWMYTGALENHSELVDQMAWIAPLWGNSGDVLENVRSPWELATTLRAAGLLFPETVATADGLPRDGSWLAKTYRGASGSGVRALQQIGRAEDGESQSDLVEAVCYQRRINGVSAAAVFADMDGVAMLIGVTRQLVGESWLGAHGFQYAGSIGPLPISDAVRQTIQHIGQALTDRFELVGLFGVDFILDGDDVWTIEVNPRYTASVEICERCTGVNAIAAHVAGLADVSVNNLIPSIKVAERAHGKAILFARREVRITPDFAEASLAEALELPWPTLADISPAGTIVEAGRPILTVFAEGDNESQVEQRLRERVHELERQLYGSVVK